eukprot:14371810-Alexandrium_andersonii.AAC.1
MPRTRGLRLEDMLTNDGVKGGSQVDEHDTDSGTPVLSQGQHRLQSAVSDVHAFAVEATALGRHGEALEGRHRSLAHHPVVRLGDA